MTTDDWTAIITAGFALAVFVATLLAIPRRDARIESNQRPEREFTGHTLGKGKHPNLLTCDDILARTLEHRRSY